MTTLHTRQGPEYGSVDYYNEQFSDVLADIGDGEAAKANVLKGLFEALTSWIDYHDTAACRYEEFAVELNALAQELARG
jgi:hypothetical protein